MKVIAIIGLVALSSIALSTQNAEVTRDESEDHLAVENWLSNKAACTSYIGYYACQRKCKGTCRRENLVSKVDRALKVVCSLRQWSAYWCC